MPLSKGQFSPSRKPLPRWILVGCLLLAMISCSKEDQAPAEIRAESYNDVAYGSQPLQQMDIYLPAGRSTTSTPLLVLIHGGAWISGDKSDFATLLDTIKSMMPGYAIANLNYRLAAIGSNLFPTQENDVDSAMQFLARHTKAYLISNHFVYLGVSAGGHLALLQAYKYASPKALAVISFFGPTDMADLYRHSPDSLISQYLPLLMDGSPEQNPMLYHNSSPINYVSTQSCPTLLLQGGKDPLVPQAEAFQLRDTLKTLKVANELIYYPNAGHGWTGSDLQDSFEKISAFLEQINP